MMWMKKEVEIIQQGQSAIDGGGKTDDGRVNAIRTVAHSLRQKINFKWGFGPTLFFSTDKQT
jgi:hypothetical protein